MTFHETILNQLKKYREHNPHFNFLVSNEQEPVNAFKVDIGFKEKNSHFKSIIELFSKSLKNEQNTYTHQFKRLE
jgi:hypothetical protein